MTLTGIIGLVFIFLIIIFSLMILNQVILGIILLNKKNRIYKKYKKIVNEEILKNKNGNIYDFLFYPKSKKLIFKSFSKLEYNKIFGNFFRLNIIKNENLKRELESYRNILRFQTKMGIILIISFIVFLVLMIIISWLLNLNSN